MTASGNGPVAPEEELPLGPADGGTTDPQTDGPTLGDRLHQRPSKLRTAFVLFSIITGLGATIAVGSDKLFAQIDEASETVGERSLVCWNAVEVDDQTDCTKPKGVRGLRWVFPSFRPGQQNCVDEIELNPSFRRPAMWTCQVRIDGRPVEITYSQLTTAQSGRKYFERLYDGDTTRLPREDGSGDRLTWAVEQLGNGDWQTTEMFLKRPFSVTVSATERDDAVAVLRDRVRIRPADEHRLRPNA